MRNSEITAYNTTAKITKEEAFILFQAQGEFLKNEKADIKCPRCGKLLKHETGFWGETTHCENPHCIRIEGRGI
ncbi:hypothetical protein FACS1894105_07600 [Clostridia bacterium]|nr:hypothetical protein FACS1894105_07600 [Clostridia bacterium]